MTSNQEFLYLFQQNNFFVLNILNNK